MPPDSSVAPANSKKVLAASILVLIVVGAIALALLSPRGWRSAPSAVPALLTTEQVRQMVIERGNHIEGKIVAAHLETTPQAISIEISLVNLATLGTITGSTTPQLTNKTVDISITNTTVFNDMNKSMLKPGALIAATLNTSIYQSEKPTALTIELADTKTQVTKGLTHLGQISGIVKNIEGSTITVVAQVADQQKLSKLNTSGSFTVPYVNKTYTIAIVPDTQFLEKQSVKNVVINASVLVWGSENLYAVDSFTATKLYVQP